MDKEKIMEALNVLEEVQNLPKSHPYEVGKTYFIRTVTYHFIFKVDKIIGNFLVGESVWVADSGRFQQAIENGALKEIEPIRKIESHINIFNIIDSYIWKHELPTTQK